jgi:hypothetical protein
LSTSQMEPKGTVAPGVVEKIAEELFEMKKMKGHPGWNDVNDGVKQFWRDQVNFVIGRYNEET